MFGRCEVLVMSGEEGGHVRASSGSLYIHLSRRHSTAYKACNYTEADQHLGRITLQTGLVLQL